jgi:hypothetical protein
VDVTTMTYVGLCLVGNNNHYSRGVSWQDFCIWGWGASCGGFTCFPFNLGNTCITRPCNAGFDVLATGTIGTVQVLHTVYLGDERLWATCGSLAVSLKAVSIFFVTKFSFFVNQQSRWSSGFRGHTHSSSDCTLVRGCTAHS